MFLDELDAREYYARRELRRMEVEELEETVAGRRAERQREQYRRFRELVGDTSPGLRLTR